jgi:hypothetical protein
MIDTLAQFGSGFLVGLFAVLGVLIVAVVADHLSDPLDDEDPQVYYVPNMYNHYSFSENIVVLDENLKEYPEAHKHIKEHELNHAESFGLWYTLKLEFETDVERLFGDSEEIEEVNQYMDNRSVVPLTMRIKTSVINIFRNIWMMILSPMARVYKFFKGGDSDE